MGYSAGFSYALWAIAGFGYLLWAIAKDLVKRYGP
jgi:type IV secretory pathway TrbD component